MEIAISIARLDSGQLQHRFLHHGTLQGERDEAHGGQFQEVYSEEQTW